MKNILITIVAVVFLSGCDGQAKTDLVAQLRLKFENDKDLADYRISAEEMSECVADKILKEISGFPGSPKRKRHIEAYTKLVRVNPAEDFRPALESTKEVFGSAAKAHEAATSITTSNFDCIGDMINGQPLKQGQG